MLPPIRVRLSDADRAELSIDSEWLPFHALLFVERRALVLRQWEQQADVKILELLAGKYDLKVERNLTALFWLACQVNDVKVPPFDEFSPHTFAAEMEGLDLRPEADDVDPPASSSTAPSVEQKPRRSRAGSKS